MLSIVKMISAPNQIENVASIIIIGLFIYLLFFFLVLLTNQVQPVAELVELSRRWAVDGREIRLNEVIAKGGTLRRTGSLRHRGRLQVPSCS